MAGWEKYFHACTYPKICSPDSHHYILPSYFYKFAKETPKIVRKKIMKSTSIWCVQLELQWFNFKYFTHMWPALANEGASHSDKFLINRNQQCRLFLSRAFLCINKKLWNSLSRSTAHLGGRRNIIINTLCAFVVMVCLLLTSVWLNTYSLGPILVIHTVQVKPETSALWLVVLTEQVTFSLECTLQ